MTFQLFIYSFIFIMSSCVICHTIGVANQREKQRSNPKSSFYYHHITLTNQFSFAVKDTTGLTLIDIQDNTLEWVSTKMRHFKWCLSRATFFSQFAQQAEHFSRINKKKMLFPASGMQGICVCRVKQEDKAMHMEHLFEHSQPYPIISELLVQMNMNKSCCHTNHIN